MKKSLIALAALATVATAAQAQSSVTVYGVLDAGVLYRSSANATGDAATSIANGILATPRIGFRGSEDLGSGLKAVFQLETGFNNGSGAQSSSTNLFDRFAYVGLANSIGQIDFGRNTHAGWNAAAAGITDILSLQGEGLSLAGSAAATQLGVVEKDKVPNWRTNQVISIVGNTGLGTTRSDSMAKFTSATFNGFTVRAGYGIGGQAGDSDRRASQSFGVTYVAGNFGAAASTFEAKDDTAKKLKYDSYGATYTLAGVKVAAGYHQLKADANYNRTGTSDNLALGVVYAQPLKNSGTGDSKTTVWNLGASYQLTPALNTALGYYEGKFENAAMTASNGNGAKLKSYVWVNKYALSKRTTAYVAVDHAKADTAIRAGANADSMTGFAVGVNHTF